MDWIAVMLYLILIVFGWLNLYAANFNPENPIFFDTGKEYFKQLIWIVCALTMIWVISHTDSKFFVEIAYPFFGFTVLLLLAVLFFGKEVNGAKAWFEIGPLRIQPAEFTKVATGLVVARVVSRYGFTFSQFSHWGKLVGLLLIPIMFIFLQNDTGSALVYFSFILVFYREGMSPLVLIIGMLAAVVAVMALMLEPHVIYIVMGVLLIVFIAINRNFRAAYYSLGIAFLAGGTGYILKEYFGFGFSYLLLVTGVLVILSVFYLYLWVAQKARYFAIGVMLLWLAMAFSFASEYFFHHVLSDYQLTRIHVLFGMEEDPLGAGYNVTQAKIAIGSGGFAGKGFLQGTQTKFNFVPEQSTDFIFCTVGEEWGFIGTTVVVLLYMSLLLRLVFLAERQHSVFSRVFGYCVASILFFHVAINIGMTIGLAPVIGIPLPLFSYGGSSLWGFTMLLFIFLKLDTNKSELIR
ncbi:MAG: rod shape-determining protein RodA [Breznakibacter sp.]